MLNSVRYGLLTSGLLFGAMAHAAPAGDLPLMPWPAQVERPQSPGALVVNNALTLNVTGDVPGDAGAAGASALPARPAGRYNRKWRRLPRRQLTWWWPKKCRRFLVLTVMKATS